MKLVIGSREFKLTWKDGCVVGGGSLVVMGLWMSFGFGILLASAGALVAAVPFLRVESAA